MTQPKERKAMLAVFAEGKYLTRDLGGTTNTADFASAIIEKLRANETAAA